MAVPALLAFAIPAIVSAIGSIFSTISANRNADDAAAQALELQKNNQEWEEEQAQKQMDFQTSANKIIKGLLKIFRLLALILFWHIAKVVLLFRQFPPQLAFLQPAL